MDEHVIARENISRPRASRLLVRALVCSSNEWTEKTEGLNLLVTANFSCVQIQIYTVELKGKDFFIASIATLLTISAALEARKL